MFLLFLPVSCLGRFFQLFATIEPATGFYNPDYLKINIFMGIFFAVFLILIFISSLFLKKYSDDRLPKSKAMSLASLVMSLAVLIDIGSLIGTNEISIFNMVYLLLIVLTAGVFCINAITNFADTNISTGGMMIIPIIFWLFRLIRSFLFFTGIANISENVIKIVLICCSIVFLLFHGKIYSEFDLHKNKKLAVSFGMISSVLCFVSTLPRYVIYFIDKTKLHECAVGDFTDFALGIYIIVFIYLCFKREKIEN